MCDFRSLDEQSDLVGVMSVLPTRGQHPVYGGSNPKNSTGEIERWVWQLLLSIIHVCVSVLQLTTFFFFFLHQGIGLQSRSQVVLCLQHATRRMFVSQMLRLSHRWHGTMYATFCFHDGAGRRTSKGKYRSSMYRDLGLNNITTEVMRNTIDLHDCHLSRFERLYCMYQMMMITTRFNLYTMVPPAAAGDFTYTSFFFSFPTIGSLDVTSQCRSEISLEEFAPRKD